MPLNWIGERGREGGGPVDSSPVRFSPVGESSSDAVDESGGIWPEKNKNQNIFNVSNDVNAGKRRLSHICFYILQQKSDMTKKNWFRVIRYRGCYEFAL